MSEGWRHRVDVFSRTYRAASCGGVRVLEGSYRRTQMEVVLLLV